ncbi:hypothetical protein BT93_H3536 [Corymbia citriodora subsp. variegata]|nr:hypothetical protein BT93_H3536 [Corymbia citriodora subsp. variegata]
MLGVPEGQCSVVEAFHAGSNVEPVPGLSHRNSIH